MVVLEDDVETRDAMRDDGCHTFRSRLKFTQKQKDKEFNKSKLLSVMVFSIDICISFAYTLVPSEV